MAYVQRDLVRDLYEQLRKVIDLPPRCLEVTIHVSMGEMPTVTATYFPDESKATGEPVTQRFTLTPMDDNGGDASDTAIRHALANVLAAVAKRADAPMSSETHLDSAIAQLASVTAWRPADREFLAIIDDAVAHMEMLSGESSSSEGV